MTNSQDLNTLSVNDEFKRGFNAGYLLAQHAAHEVKAIKNQKNQSDFSLGFIAGEKEFIKEKTKARIKNAKSLSKDKEIDD